MADKPIDPIKMAMLEHEARCIAPAIDHILTSGLPRAFQKRETGFCLILFSYIGPELTYISNAARGDMIEALKEMVEKLESNQDQPPTPTGAA